MAESPGSPLSSLASDDFTEDIKPEDLDPSVDPLGDQAMRPSKRQRTGPAWEQRLSFSRAAYDTETDISTDTEGDVPGSPTAISQLHDEEAIGHEQVTVCHWEGCLAGDLGNMDSLVEHIHEDHIGHRQKKYACEWDDCTRKSTPHASGYALRAHMRSHTKEKPFFCQLPECDRSFTRSDALAKHMRTVHETEALRPSDPVPRNHSNPPPRPQRIKLILSARPPAERPDGDGDDVEADLDDDETTILSPDDYEVGLRSTNASDPYPSDLHLTDEEKAMPPSKLLALLKFQMECVEEERVQLLDDVAGLEKLKFREWQNKELLLENVMEAELAFHEQRAARKRAGSTKQGEFATMKILPEKNLPLTGDLPWWRTTASKPGEETEGFRTLDPEEAIS